MPKCNECDKTFKAEDLQEVGDQVVCPGCAVKLGGGGPKLVAIDGQKPANKLTYDYEGEEVKVNLAVSEKSGAVTVKAGPVVLALEVDWDRLNKAISG